MHRFAGTCQFVSNKALALQKQRHEQGEKKLGYAELCKLLTDWPTQTRHGWPKHPLQQVLKNLERAYTNFFDKCAALPRFKRKDQGDSFRYPDAKQFQIDQGNSRIKLPKLGWVQVRLSREVLGTPKNITFSFSGGKWFASIQTEREVDMPIPPAP